MAVYKRGQVYSYDFQFKGQRFAGTTGCTNKLDAKAAEKRLRDELKAEDSRNRLFGPNRMTVNEAFGQYWEEVGQHAKSHRDIEWSFHYIIKHLGADKALADITDSDVARLVSRRRGDNVSYPKQVNGKSVKPRVPKRVSASTVNRSVTQPLRRVLRRAEKNWGEQVGRINWSAHMLKEPQERVRYASDAEEAALFEKLPKHYHGAVRFAFISGLRANELCGMRWSDIDWHGQTITIQGKADKIAPIPLSEPMIEILSPMRPKGVQGGRIWMNMSGGAMSYRALSAAFVTACKQAGIVGLRLHDARHTTATRLLRATGNLKMVSKLLRHSDVSTTAKYAHVLDTDLRDAMNALSAQKVPSKVPSPGS